MRNTPQTVASALTKLSVTSSFTSSPTSQYLNFVFLLLWFTLTVFANAHEWEETM
jgi:hypothetical protein